MNKIENLLSLCGVYNNMYLDKNTYKNICININIFCDIMTITGLGTYFNPITNHKILLTGLYAKIYNTNIWVSKSITDGYIRLSNLEITNSPKNINDIVEINKWSPEISLEFVNKDNIDRMMNMKAFW